MNKKQSIVNNQSMFNFKISKIIDFIFINFIVFMIVLSWTKYIFLKRSIYFPITLIVILIFNIILLFVNSRKKNIKKINSLFEKDLESYMLTLLTNNEQENITFFKNLFSKLNFDTYILNNNLIVKKNKKENIILPFFKFKDLQLEYILKKINFNTDNKIKNLYILCYQSDLKTKRYLESIENINIKIIEKKEILFSLLIPTNYYPEIKIKFKKNKKYKLKELINLSFEKKFAKKYFISGLILFLSSFFVGLNFYYLFFSSVLFFFCLICFTKKENTTTFQI